jgi:hypothetical protein
LASRSQLTKVRAGGGAPNRPMRREADPDHRP